LPAGLRVAIEVPLPRTRLSWDIAAEPDGVLGQNAA